MTDERSLDELLSYLIAWDSEASDFIRTNLSHVIVTRSIEKWKMDDDGQFRRSLVDQPMWSQELKANLQQLASYVSLLEASRESSVVGPLIGKLVGTAVGLSPFDFWNFAMTMLPGLNEWVDNRFSSFDLRYYELNDQITRRDATYQVTCYLHGVSFEAGHLELEPGITIERLTQHELEGALDLGLLLPPFGAAPMFLPPENGTFALKIIKSLPRIVGEEISDTERLQLGVLQNPLHTGEELLQCLALMSKEGFSFTGFATKRIDVDFSMLGGSISFQSLASRPANLQLVKLDLEQARELIEFWKVIHNDSFPGNKAVVLAVRRLSFATQRERLEDRLIDILIAAEAFYLTDAAGGARDRGELKYRLSLRAAVWSAGTMKTWTRREVFSQMKRGYDLRSIVAHGSIPRPADIKVKGRAADMAEFVYAIEEIVRAGLRKALKQISSSGRLSIQWDDLVLADD